MNSLSIVLVKREWIYGTAEMFFEIGRVKMTSDANWKHWKIVCIFLPLLKSANKQGHRSIGIYIFRFGNVNAHRSTYSAIDSERMMENRLKCFMQLSIVLQTISLSASHLITNACIDFQIGCVCCSSIRIHWFVVLCWFALK